MRNDRRVYIYKRKMPQLRSRYPFSIGNQTSDYREPVAIPFRFLGDCIFREKLRETAQTPRTRNDLFSRKSIYAGGVCQRIQRLVQTFPTRRISKDRLRSVICCSRFAGINFYGLVSPFLYGAPSRELPCVIDGGRARTLENRDQNRWRQVSSPLSLSSYSSSFLRSSRLIRSFSLPLEQFSSPFSFSTWRSKGEKIWKSDFRK